MIRLEDIDAGNWRIPFRVSKEQEQYVANTTTILARAYAYRNDRSQALLSMMMTLLLGWFCTMMKIRWMHISLAKY